MTLCFRLRSPGIHSWEFHGVLEENLPLPAGWENRVTIYTYDISDSRDVDVYVPDVDDIATSKLVAHREKDRECLQAMYDAGYIDLQNISNNVFNSIEDFDHARYLQGLLERIERGDHTEWRE